MKKKVLSALLLAGTSVAFFSCNNGDYTATPAGGTTWNGSSSGGGVMTAKVNGVQWTANTGLYTSNGFTALMGMSNDGKTMTLGIFTYNGPNTYTMDATTTGSWTASGTTTASSTGQIVVTSEQNNVMKGTFQWSGNGVTVTDGTFNLTKQ